MASVPSHSRTRRTHRRTLSAGDGSSASRRSHTFSDSYGGEVSGVDEVYEQIQIDEAGQITAGQISPGAVTGAAFASTIAPVILVHGLPTLPNPAYPVDVFVYDIDAVPKRLYKNVANVWTAAIGPDDIQANSITAGQIAAGAIATSELAVSLVLPGSLANEAGGTPGVFLDSTGMLIRSGKLILQDEFGTTAMQASGFSGSWRDFVALGLYNARFQAGVAGAVALGRTSALPFWTVANAAGTPVLTYVAGGTLRFTWAAINTSKKITSDLVPVVPLRAYEVGFGRTVTRVAGSVRYKVTVFWYKGDLSASSTPSTVAHDTTWSVSSAATVIVDPLQVPADAYFAAYEILAEELTTHNAGNQLDVFLTWLSPAATAILSAIAGTINTGSLTVTGVGVVSDLQSDTLDVGVGSFVVNGLGEIQTYFDNVPTAYTPTVTNFGTATFTTREAYWYRVGKMIFVRINLVINAVGAGGGTLGVNLPVSADIGAGRPLLAMTYEGMTGLVANDGMGMGIRLTGSGDGLSLDRLRTATNENITRANLTAGAFMQLSGWYEEA